MTAPTTEGDCVQCGRQGPSMVHMLPHTGTYGWWTEYAGIKVHAYVAPKEGGGA